MAETKQREVEEGRRKKRRTGDGDKIDYLKEKSKEHIDLKREELELKRKELEIRERELELKARVQEARLKTQENLTKTMMQQQLQAIILQLQQQNNAVIALLSNMQK